MRSSYYSLFYVYHLIDIIIQKSDERPGGVWYKGFAEGHPNYNVDISIRGNKVYGSVTTYGRDYNIYPTDVVIDGEIVHLVVASDILDTRFIEEKYPIDPLTFEIVNEDNIMHDFAIEVYDPYNNLIFDETYSLQPGETIQSPEISKQLGLHLYVYKLDTNETFTLHARVSREANLGSSEKVSFIFVNDTEHPMLIGTTVA